MPVGYNNIFCNYGDKGTSTVYFRTKRKIRGIDLTQAVVEIHVGFADIMTKYSTSDAEPCVFVETKTVSPGTGLVDIIWNVPPEVTFNDIEYIGNIAISIVFIQNGKKWFSQTFNKLNIGESFAAITENPIAPSVDWIDKEIDRYLASYEFIIVAT
jgi:hypothetical protein